MNDKPTTSPAEPKPVATSANPPFGLVDLAMLGVTLVWGLNFAVVKHTFAEMLPLTFNGLRFVLSSALMLALTLLIDKNLRVRRSDVPLIILTGLIGNGLYQILFIKGLALTTAGNSALLVATNPIFIALLTALFGLERITPRMWVGILLSFAGIVLVIGSSDKGLGINPHTLPGDALTLLAGLCWGVYALLTRPLVRRYSPIKVTTLSMLAGTPLILLAAIPDLTAQDWSAITLRGWGGLGFSFFLSISMAYIVYSKAISVMGNARTGIYSNLVPVVTMIAAALTLGERVGWLQIGGALIILAGIYLTRAGGRR